MRGFLVFSLVLSASWLWAPSVWAPSWPSAYVVVAAPDPSPLLLAIRDVESSGGKDCGPGGVGELTCWQIRPETAELMGCHPFWSLGGWPAQDCADRWIVKGQSLCRRVDTYGIALWYNAGRCMRAKAKPTAYSMDVARAMLRYL